MKMLQFMQGTVAKIANEHFLQKRKKEFPDMSAKKTQHIFKLLIQIQLYFEPRK